MSQLDLTLLMLPLVALGVAGLLLAFAAPAIQAHELRNRRLALALGSGQGEAGTASAGAKAAARRKAIAKTLKEIEERQAALHGHRRRPGLQQRLHEAGLGWKPHGYWMFAAAVAAVVFLAASGLGPLVAAGLALGAGLAVPHLYVGFRRKRRMNAFAALFPDVIDVIVRGVRAGRPMADCLVMIAADAEEPIRSEFRLVVEDQSVGIPIQEAVDRLARRVPLQEVAFLSIVISIQNRAGGSLTEALGNLSTVLRGRRQLQAKVKALSAEAKTSAWIIGSLPVIVASLIQVTSPEYLSVLYQTNLGLFILGACAGWMGIGAFLMRQMINFDM